MAFKMKGSPMKRNFGIGSPINKTYREAYKDADKSKYDTYEKFEKAAKDWNIEKYGTTEPTRDYKKQGLKSKKELASKHTRAKQDKKIKEATSQASLKAAEAKEFVRETAESISKRDLRREKRKALQGKSREEKREIRGEYKKAKKTLKQLKKDN